MQRIENNDFPIELPAFEKIIDIQYRRHSIAPDPLPATMPRSCGLHQRHLWHIDAV
jgi:hypothetical protein